MTNFEKLQAFVVCRGYTQPPGFHPAYLQALLAGAAAAQPIPATDAAMRAAVPFLACGDLSGWDADANYDLEPEYVSLEPVQPPTAPAYKTAIELAKAKKVAATQ